MPYTKDPPPIVRATSRPTAISFSRTAPDATPPNAVRIAMFFEDIGERGLHVTLLLSDTSLTAQQKTDLGALIDQIGADALEAQGFTEA